MSRKVNTFASIITNPLPLHTFIVKIPEFDFNEIVESAALPQEVFRQVTLYTQGEPVIYPTTPECKHEWAVKIPDSDDGKINSQFLRIRSKFFDQKTGLFAPKLWFDTEIFVRDLANKPVLSTVLHGCWLKGRGDVALDVSDPTKPLKWDWMFTFQWLEDKQLK